MVFKIREDKILRKKEENIRSYVGTEDLKYFIKKSYFLHIKTQNSQISCEYHKLSRLTLK